MAGAGEPPRTVPALVEEAARRAEGRPAFVRGEGAVGFDALADASRRAARGLADLGVGAGDRVALWLPNLPAWPALFVACARIGAVAVAVNTRFRAAEVGDILARSGARVLAFQPDFRGIDFPAILADVPAEALDRLEAVVVCGGGTGKEAPPATVAGRPAVAWRALLDRPPLDPAREAAGPDVPCVVFTTSGTTSAPKFVLHRQAAIARHAAEVATGFGYRADDAVLLQALPYCGVFGFCQAMAALAAGRPSVVMEVFDGARAAGLIARHRVTHMNGTDGMFLDILGAADGDGLRSLRHGGFAAFANPEADALVAAGDRAGVALAGLYGMSEVQALFARRPADAPPGVRALAGGRPVSPGARVRVRDPESGRLLPVGGIGALEVGGPSRFLAYDGDPEATAAALTADGFVRTGDLAELEPDGGFRFLARLGEEMRLGGFLVAPREIEAEVERHPSVAACQVVGVPGPGGTRPVAFVVPAAGGGFEEAAVLAHCADRMARFKVPVRILALDAFPTTPSPNGVKIQRAKLRAMAAEALAERGARGTPPGPAER